MPRRPPASLTPCHPWALHSQQLLSPARLSAAYGLTVRTSVALLRQFNTEIDHLEAELIASFEGHPDAEILCSLPGLGSVLGARVLAEFRDDPTRYKDAGSRRCYAGTAPITRASGTKSVVLARSTRNRRMAQACYLWAFSALRPVTGCAWLLRPAAGQRQIPPSSSSRAWKSHCGSPARMPRQPQALRRAGGVVTSGAGCCLTTYGRGMSGLAKPRRPFTIQSRQQSLVLGSGSKSTRSGSA